MNDTQTRPNPNLLFCETFVGGLAHAGLQAVCVAPGSRSTPLAMAFDAHPAIETFLHLDERCASFFALGMAQASGRPVALVCTSGTAAVEFHAAAVEAQMAGVPLLLLTADRPPELRHSGANQTIDQVKMYGDHVLWAVDAALPQDDAPEVALRNLRTLAARAYDVADGLRKGPVHVNLPFRKPLEPPAPYRPNFDGAGWPKASNSRPQFPLPTPYASIQRGLLQPSTEQIDEMVALVSTHERGWIVCGPWAGGTPRALVIAVAELARRTGYPIFADPMSGLRFGPHTASAPVVGSYESVLQNPPPFDPPEVVIRIGAVPTSKYLNDYLERAAPRHQIHVRCSGVWADDSHRVRYFLQVDEGEFCRRLAERSDRGTGNTCMTVLAADLSSRLIQTKFLEDNWFDASAVAAVVDSLPTGANLFLGNSLPVRHVDQFVPPNRKQIHVYGNRGASGIDGVVSSALGVAAADRCAPMLLLIGDVSFYHDLNGLLAVRKHNLANVTIVLLHNDGGGVFRRLPVAKGHAQFERLFLTPHGLDFAPAAAMYGLDHMLIADEDRATLAEVLHASLHGSCPTIIEVRTDGARDERLRRELVKILSDSMENIS